MEDWQDLLEGLNDAQREAVTTTEGFVRVLAGAGSGKTRALTHRFAYLVEELGILPGNILCVTFTNKAATEMRSRIHALTGDNDTGYINTFHGFCVSILQEDSHAVGYPKSFLVLDNADIDDMLAKIYEERGLTLRDMTYSQARDMFEMRKLVQQPDYYKELIALPLAALKEKYDRAQTKQDILFYGYLYEEKKCFGLDYNDLIKFSLHIFAEHEDIRKKWQQRLEYIMIDEFQDIDEPQYRLMNVLCGWHKNLFVVGDPDQTIYTWRGASGRYLLDFDTHFPGTKTIYMLENYRSTPEILSVVNSLIAKNTSRIEKDLVPVKGHGHKVVCHHATAASEEASWLAGEMARLHEEGVAYREMAVLYRAHYITRSIEEQLLRAEIPYMIYSGVQFFARREIKDALSYLRLLAYRDDLSLLRVVNVPKRNIGQRRRKFLTEYAEAHEMTLYQAMRASIEDPIWKGTKAREFLQLVEGLADISEGASVSEVLAEVLDRSGYEAMLRTEGSQARLDNLAELKQSVREYEVSCGEEAGPTDYLAHAALFTNQDISDPGDKVKLMTVHTAKGLEFPYVFICGMNEGIFPSRKTRTVNAMEEERRLAFVAMTRAEKALYITEAGGANLDGSPRYPSRFILDIDRDKLEFDSPVDEQLMKETMVYVGRSTAFLQEDKDETTMEAGTRVRHPVFGPGTIVEVDGSAHAYLIKFDSMPTMRQISFHARLFKL